MEMQAFKQYQEFSEKQFTKRVVFNSGGSTAFILNFMPGQKLPEHKHPGSEVYLFVVQGSGTIIIDGKETEVAPQTIIHSGGDDSLAFDNTGSEPASVYVVLSKVPSEEYTKDI